MVILSDKCQIFRKNETDGAEIVSGDTTMQAQIILDKFLISLKKIFTAKKLENGHWDFDMNFRPKKTPPTITATITTTLNNNNTKHDFHLDLIPAFMINNAIFIPFKDTNNFQQTNSYFEQYFFNSDIPDLNSKIHFALVVRIFKVCHCHSHCHRLPSSSVS